MSESIKVKKLGKYILQEKLGEGSMGSVWLSQHTGLNIPVAIKLLNMDLAAEDPDFLNRFMQEGRLAGQLNHKNIVRTYDAGMENGCAYIVMEYIEGCDTLELLETRGALPPDEVLALAIGATEALQEAHSLGIIHRDIKPDNILATTDGRIKLADLGLAKQVNDDFGSTMAGTALGTPYYISPEQALDALKADARSDIYSLGATLYHLLSGFLPYEGDNVMGVMLRHANEPLVPPQEKKPDLPLSFCRVICKMMEKDPAERYQNCDELLEDLLKLKYGNEDVALSNEDLIQKSEKELRGELTSSKSVRVKVKIPNKGKYAHKKGSSSKKSSKKNKVSKKDKRNKTPLLIGVVILIVLIIVRVSIPFNPNNTQSNNETVVELKNANGADTGDRKVKRPPKKTKVNVKVIPETTASKSLNLLAAEGQEFFEIAKPDFVSFKNGHMFIKGTAEGNLSYLTSKKAHSNYKILIEFKWHSMRSDTGILVHQNDDRNYEVNLSNNYSPTGTLHGRQAFFVNEEDKRLWYHKPEEQLTKTQNQWHSVEIVCNSNNIKVSVDGNELYNFKDLKLSEGYITMSLWKHVDIEIRKLELTPLN